MVKLSDSFLELRPIVEYPKGPEYFPEEFEIFYRKVSQQYKNIPREAFIEWLYPFWHSHVKSLYGNLDFKRLRFELVSQPIDFFRNVKWYQKFDRVQTLSQMDFDDFKDLYKTWPQVLNSWTKQGTWLTPIWVLDSTSFKTGLLSTDVQFPYMLVEGHSRLGTLFSLSANSKVAEQHLVWIISEI